MLVDPQVDVRPFEVLSFSPGRAKRVLVLSPMIGFKVHFIHSSRICAGASCPACAVGMAGKFQGYVVVMFDSQRRLLRLTAGPAKIGSEAGIFVAGTILEVSKCAARRPLVCLVEGTSKKFDASNVVSRVELLSVVARLHGLVPVPAECSFEAGIEVIKTNAQQVCRLALDQKAG